MKKLAAVVLSLVMMLSLTACIAKNEDAPSKDAENNESGVNVVTGYKPGDVTLPQYKGLTFTPLSTEVTEEEIQSNLDYYVQSYKTKVEVTDRDTVQTGDIVSISYEGIKDGVAFDGGTGSTETLQIGSGTFIPGFEDALIGKSKGQFSIDVTFPENYKTEALAGQDAVFNIDLKGIYTYVYPELTDEFIAEKTDNKYTTVAEYREYIREAIKKSKESEAEEQKLYDLVNKIIDMSTFNVDLTSAIKSTVSTYKKYYDNLGSSYGLDGAGYFRIAYGTTSQEYEDSLKKQADYQVKFDYIKSAIADIEKFEATDEEVEALATSLMKSYGYTTKEAFYEVIKSNNGLDGDVFLREQIKLNKATDLILNTAVPE